MVVLEDGGAFAVRGVTKIKPVQTKGRGSKFLSFCENVIIE